MPAPVALPVMPPLSVTSTPPVARLVARMPSLPASIRPEVLTVTVPVPPLPFDSFVRGADFEQARLKAADFRSSRLEDPRGDLSGLRGAIVDSIQLSALAPLLAQRLGIEVDDG